MAVEYIADKAHYDRIIEWVASVKQSLWIGTADIKDFQVKAGNTTEPFFGVMAKLFKRGKEVRLVYAKEPRPAFRA